MFFPSSFPLWGCFYQPTSPERRNENLSYKLELSNIFPFFASECISFGKATIYFLRGENSWESLTSNKKFYAMTKLQHGKHRVRCGCDGRVGEEYEVGAKAKKLRCKVNIRNV